ESTAVDVYRHGAIRYHLGSMRTTALLLTVAAALAVPSTPAQSGGFAEGDRILTDYARRTHVPGAVWGVLVDGRPRHTGAIGVRDVAAKDKPTADTVFRIASMTKSFTAMSILKLRDEGRLALDDPAEKYVPELASLKYPTTDSPKITIRHLLTHSTGF